MSRHDDAGLRVTTPTSSAERIAALDKLGHEMWRSVSEQGRDTQAKNGLKALTAQVVAVDSSRNVSIRRPENSVADGQKYPVLAPAYLPAVGDWVTGFELDGGAWIMGRRAGPTDRDIPDLAANKLERNGTQSLQPSSGNWLRVNKGTSSDKIVAELYKDSGSGVLETALRFHQGSRYWSRLAADGAGLHAKTGDTASNAYVNFRAADLIADNGATLKDNRVRADNAAANANTRLKRDGTEAVTGLLTIAKGGNNGLALRSAGTGVGWNFMEFRNSSGGTRHGYFGTSDVGDIIIGSEVTGAIIRGNKLIAATDFQTDTGVTLKDARVRADNAQGRADGAYSRADAAHSRTTNAAIDAAHDAVDATWVRADNAHRRADNLAIDAAHDRADSAYSLASGKVGDHRHTSGYYWGPMDANGYVYNIAWYFDANTGYAKA